MKFQAVVFVATVCLASVGAARSQSPPFSLICPKAAAGGQTLQINVHVGEGWYASGLAHDKSTYTNSLAVTREGIRLDMTGTLQRRQGAQWTLKGGWRSAGGELYFCKEIDFEPLKDENYPFVQLHP